MFLHIDHSTNPHSLRSQLVVHVTHPIFSFHEFFSPNAIDIDAVITIIDIYVISVINNTNSNIEQDQIFTKIKEKCKQVR